MERVGSEEKYATYIANLELNGADWKRMEVRYMYCQPFELNATIKLNALMNCS